MFAPTTLLQRAAPAPDCHGRVPQGCSHPLAPTKTLTTNPHLSVFRPYDRDPGHEDQLTRAALVLMRLVPLAQEAFLRLATDHGLVDLPPGQFDMQTAQLADSPGTPSEEDSPEGEAEVEELRSVFLSPDADRPLGKSQVDIEHPRRQRFDGVVRYLPKLWSS